MIVFSRSLILSLTDEIDPKKPILLWQNLITRQNIEADSALAAYPVSNLANPSTLEGWRSDSTDEQYVTAEFDGSEINCVGVVGQNWGSGQITVSVEALPPGDDPDWVEVIEEFMPADDSPLILRFEADFYTSIRIRLQPTDTAPRAAVVYVGKALHMPRGISAPHTPLDLGRSTDVINGRSRGGSFLGNVVVGQSNETSVQFQGLPRAWYYDVFEPELALGATAPFFFAWLPQERPHDVGYAWLMGDPRPQFRQPILGVDVTLEIGGIVS